VTTAIAQFMRDMEAVWDHRMKIRSVRVLWDHATLSAQLGVTAPVATAPAR